MTHHHPSAPTLANLPFELLYAVFLSCSPSDVSVLGTVSARLRVAALQVTKDRLTVLQKLLKSEDLFVLVDEFSPAEAVRKLPVKAFRLQCAGIDAGKASLEFVCKRSETGPSTKRRGRGY
ncbi:hypothetical protein HKX48_006378 [Thoreauomyces humboldtii]|nr:hypothetical protein HKX48_006378 [Thoreauomyces humboldtii]